MRHKCNVFELYIIAGSSPVKGSLTIPSFKKKHSILDIIPIHLILNIHHIVEYRFISFTLLVEY